MDKQQILNELQEIIRDVLDKDDVIISTNTVASDVEGWDSLVHVEIVTDAQKVFGVKFSAKEMISWNTVDDICETILKKLA